MDNSKFYGTAIELKLCGAYSSDRCICPCPEYTEGARRVPYSLYLRPNMSFDLSSSFHTLLRSARLSQNKHTLQSKPRFVT